MLNPVHIFLAGLATIPVGFVWYSPALFAKQWTKLNGLNAKKMKKGSMLTPFLVTFLTSFVLAILLSLFIELLGIQDLSNAWKLATILWFGFHFLPGLTQTLFSRRPLELLLIDSGHYAVNVILIAWVLMALK